MEYKEKYFEALERATQLSKQGGTHKYLVCQIFPELVESEDERTRNEIIAFVEQSIHRGGGTPIPEKQESRWIAWLERQGAQKPYGLREECKDCQCNYAGECKGSCAMKRNEQKPTWSEEDEKMVECCEIALEFFEKLGKNTQGFPHENYFELDKKIYPNEVNPWLASLKDRVQPKQEWKQENIGDLTDFEAAMMHIGDSFFGQDAGLNPNDINAIKEQANLLLELVPSKEWSEEDEKILATIIEEGYLKPSERQWLRTLKDRVQSQPKQDWSEEDKRIIMEIISDLDYCKAIYTDDKYESVDNEINWLKSLRPQNIVCYNPYKEVVESIAAMVEKYAPFDSNLQDFYDNVKVKCKDAKEYDSLFSQNRWKPSDEQMDILLSEVTAWTKGCPKQIVLESLYNDLKKLKGE